MDNSKKPNDMTKKKAEKIMSRSVKTMFSRNSDIKKNSAQTQKSLSQSLPLENSTRVKSQTTKFLSRNLNQHDHTKKFPTSQSSRNFRTHNQQRFSQNRFSKQNSFTQQLPNFQNRFSLKIGVHSNVSNQKFENDRTKPNVKFTPQKPNFPNPSVNKPSKVSYIKGHSDMNNLDHWLEGKGKIYQSGKFSQQ